MKFTVGKSLGIFTVILAAALVAFYLPFLTGQANFYLFDISTYYEPTIKVLSESWRNGQFMLWNPYPYCGMPQIAVTEPGLFYPPNWLFAFVPFSAGLGWSLILHQLLAGVGSFLLIVSFGWGLIPAFLAGFAASLGGYMFSLQTNYSLMACASWFPLLLWLVRSVDSKSSLSRSLATCMTGLCTGFMVLTGRPEIFGPAFMIVGLYVAFSCAWKISIGESKLPALYVAFVQLASIVLGVAIAAPGILPAMEWLPLSPRAEGLVPADTLFWSANWYDFLCLLLPQPLGDLYLRGAPFANLALANPALEPYFASAFLGPIIFTLALFGICDRSWKPRWFLIAILIVFLILAAGRFTPIGEYLLYVIPGVGVLRYPVKLLFFPVLCLVIFAARGLYLILQGRVSKLVQIAVLALWSALFLAGIWLASFHEPIVTQEIPNAVTFLRLKFAAELIVQAQHLIGWASMTMAVIGLLTSLTCFLKQTNKINTKAFSVAVLGGTLSIFMLQAFSVALHPAPADYFDQKSYLERKLVEKGQDVSKLQNLGGERFVTMYLAGLMQPNNLERGGATQKTIDHYQLIRQMLFVSTFFHQHFGSSFGYLLAETADYRNLYVDTINKSHISGKKLIGKDGLADKTDLPFYRFCQVTSTAYTMGMIDKFTFGKFSKTGLLDPKLFELLVQDPSWNARIYRVKEPMPHAYLSYDWQWLNSQDEARKAIVDAEISKFDPWYQTLLEKGNLPEHGLAQPKDTGKIASAVDIGSYQNNEVKIAVDSPVPAMLVLTDHYYPGWTAYLNHKKVPIIRANAVMRAVYVPSGISEVEFRYEPDSLRKALIVTGLSLIGLFTLAFAFYLLDRKKLLSAN